MMDWKLSDFMPADKVAELNAEMAVTAAENYQPLLDSLITHFSFTELQGTVTAEAQVELVEGADGKPAIATNVTLGVKFSPETTHDMFEEAHRQIVRAGFQHLIHKAE